MSQLSLLIIDDEQALAVLLKRYLERQGHSVEVCPTGGQALQEIENNPARYQVILLDLGLPDIPGAELLPDVLRLAPESRVIIVSGTPYESDEPRVSSLLKPFTPPMLLDELARVTCSGS